jgi:prepilin-type N-terminal cleavage/methylation domain-containing protein
MMSSNRTFHARRARVRQAGFTLIEIMVVVVILGILAAIVAPNVISRIDDAAISRAKQDIRGIESALKLYYMDNSRYPSTDQGSRRCDPSRTIRRCATGAGPISTSCRGIRGTTPIATSIRAAMGKSMSSPTGPTGSRAAKASMLKSATGLSTEPHPPRGPPARLLADRAARGDRDPRRSWPAWRCCRWACCARSPAETEARRLTALLELLAEEALVQGRDYGIEFFEDGYRFLAWDPDSGLWSEVVDDEAACAVARCRPGVRVVLAVEGREVVVEDPRTGATGAARTRSSPRSRSSPAAN